MALLINPSGQGLDLGPTRNELLKRSAVSIFNHPAINDFVLASVELLLPMKCEVIVNFLIVYFYGEGRSLPGLLSGQRQN